MTGPVRKLLDQLLKVLALVGLIWLVFLLSLVLDLRQWGLVPRTFSGLAGLVTMPFLHRDLSDLFGNTVPLTVLLLILQTTRPNPWRILLCLQSGAGALIWGLGRPDLHLGAGPVLFSIAAYLITAGIHERRPIPIAAAVLVTVLYAPLFWGLLPTAGTHVFWEGHLFGALFGVIFATQTIRRLRRRTATT